MWLAYSGFLEFKPWSDEGYSDILFWLYSFPPERCRDILFHFPTTTSLHILPFSFTTLAFDAV
jgi:hypothetical protein